MTIAQRSLVARTIADLETRLAEGDPVHGQSRERLEAAIAWWRGMVGK